MYFVRVGTCVCERQKCYHNKVCCCDAIASHPQCHHVIYKYLVYIYFTYLNI